VVVGRVVPPLFGVRLGVPVADGRTLLLGRRAPRRPHAAPVFECSGGIRLRGLIVVAERWVL
jgi:hypothetical protein